MDIEREQERYRRALRKAEEMATKAAEKLAKVQKEARMARSRLKSSTARAPTWHAYRLSAQDRDAGFTGEMSEARHYLRSLLPRQYVDILQSHVTANPGVSIVQIEFTAVQANLESWTEKGKEILFQKARVAVTGADFRAVMRVRQRRDRVATGRVLRLGCRSGRRGTGRKRRRAWRMSSSGPAWCRGRCVRPH